MCRRRSRSTPPTKKRTATMTKGLFDSPEAHSDRPPARGVKRLLPNLLSVTRLLVLPLAMYLISLPDAWAPLTAAGVMLFGMLIDALDGILARRWNAVTEFGKILDPLADKVCMAGATVMLVIHRGFPLWLAAVIIGRDVAILAGGLIWKQRLRDVPMSNYLGKAAAFTVGATLIVYTLRTGFDWLEELTVWLSLALIAASLATYLVKFIRHLRRDAENGEESDAQD